MYVKNVVLSVNPEYREAFLAATLENQQHSLQEPDIVRFEFYQDDADPTRFLLFEVYSTREAVEDHLQTAHYQKWISLVRPWFLQPVERTLYRTL